METKKNTHDLGSRNQGVRFGFASPTIRGTRLNRRGKNDENLEQTDESPAT
jgi:hypothetical protein